MAREKILDFVQNYIHQLEDLLRNFNKIPKKKLQLCPEFDYQKHFILTKNCRKAAFKYHKEYKTILTDVELSNSSNINTDKLNCSENEIIKDNDDFSCKSKNISTSEISVEENDQLFSTDTRCTPFSTGNNRNKMRTETITSGDLSSVTTKFTTPCIVTEKEFKELESFVDENLLAFLNITCNKDKQKSIEQNIQENVSIDFPKNSEPKESIIQKTKEKSMMIIDNSKNDDLLLREERNSCSLTNTDQSLEFTSFEDNQVEFQAFVFDESVDETLLSVFGLTSFRPLQREVINACLQQEDCFVLMPTGGGKSLCYQLPAILTPGVTIILSPLRALIADQVAKLKQLNIPADHLCPNLTKETKQNLVIESLQMQEPNLKILYLTPEKIMSDQMMNVLKDLFKRGKIARFVIDEAHCLSQWGHDFRPKYQALSIVRREFPNVPITCLTATATELIKIDVITTLELKNVKVFITGFNRPNIKYHVFPKTFECEVAQEIANIIFKNFKNMCGIIYCLSRKNCENLTKQLNHIGLKTEAYHAGLSASVRERVQNNWMNDKINIIISTIAFGLGVDKPDVRFVIHHSLPKSVESYYQESGRAGRDGNISHSYLFYSKSDFLVQKKLLSSNFRIYGKQKAYYDINIKNVEEMMDFCLNIDDCRRFLLLRHLGQSFNHEDCFKNFETVCDNCLNKSKLASRDLTQQGNESIHKSSLSSREIEKFKNECHEELLKICSELASSKKVPISSIVNLTSVKVMSEALPKTKSEFLEINGISENFFKAHGSKFSEVVLKYRRRIEASKRTCKRRLGDSMSSINRSSNEAPLVPKLPKPPKRAKYSRRFRSKRKTGTKYKNKKSNRDKPSTSKKN